MRRSLSLLGVVAIGASLVAFLSEGRPSPKAGGQLAPLARLPLTFEPNQGQFDAGVRFVARAPGQSVAVTDAGLTISPAGVRMTLAGARTSPGEVVGEQPLPGVVSRIIGNDPAQWRSSIPTFGAVAYRDAYPGIDVVFHGAGRDVEHDFVVSPGADPAVIALAVSGARSGRAHLDGRGDLVAGDVRLRAPVLYQEGAGGRQPVHGRYEARPDGSFGFAVGAYDRSRPLVIDPVLVSSSYLGGSSTDTAYGVATDADGNVVVTGYTESSDFPTVNPAQAGRPGAEGTRRDIFVTKVKADGTGLLWSTYLGGRGQDAAFAVAVGQDGAVYVTGYVESPDFPTVKPLQSANGGGTDAFVVKLNAAGSAIEYATYIGGAGADSGSGIAVDSAGAAYVVGATGSTNFPTAKPIQASLARADDQDGFALKLDPSGSSLAWSTFLGGSGDDHAIDSALDGAGNLYVTGDTKSANFPTVRPFQPNPGTAGTGVGGNFADAFVTKIKSDGTALEYSSYLGGSDSDKGTGIAVDGTGSAYVTGNTGSTNFPVVGGFQAKKNGDFDGFVAKVRPDGSGLAYSSYLGGSGSDGAEAIAVDQQGHAHVAGATASNDFPTVKPAQSVKGGGFVDAFVSEVSASGNALVSSSYLGGRDDDQAAGIAVDHNGNVVTVGYTNSSDFPIAKPFQPGKGGGVGDAFLSKVRPEVAGDVATPPAATSKHERRIRTLVTITGGLFLAAILQSVWLRRRPEPARPAPRQPSRPGEPAEEPLPVGVQYLPRRGRLESRSVDGRSFTDESPGRTLLDDRRLDEVEGDETAPEDEDDVESDDLWGPDRPWRQSSTGPDWDRGARPNLRPLERPPAPAAPTASRMPAPDLWEPEPEPKPQPQFPREPAVASAAAPPRSAPAPAAAAPVVRTSEPGGADAWGVAGVADLDPLDAWGPLTGDVEPDEWLRDMEDVGLTAPPVEVVPEPEPEPEPPPAPEPAPMLLAPEPEPQSAVEAEPDLWESEPEPAVAVAVAPEPEATVESEPEAAVAPQPGPPAGPEPMLWALAPEPEPEAAPAVVATLPRELSISELLSEDFPIPEPAPLPTPPPPASDPLRDLLDEEMPIPDTVPDTVPDDDDFLPPPPPRLLVNLFEPDPDDPLVQAQRAAEGGEDEPKE